MSMEMMVIVVVHGGGSAFVHVGSCVVEKSIHYGFSVSLFIRRTSHGNRGSGTCVFGILAMRIIVLDTRAARIPLVTLCLSSLAKCANRRVSQSPLRHGGKRAWWPGVCVVGRWSEEQCGGFIESAR